MQIPLIHFQLKNDAVSIENDLLRRRSTKRSVKTFLQFIVARLARSKRL